MISLDGAARQIAGAWMMAFNAPDWRRRLARSTDDVFGSSAAIIISSALVGLAALTAKRAAARVPDLSEVVAAAPLPALIGGNVLIFLLDWAASLTLLLMVVRAADIIVGFNWIQPIVAAAQLPSIVLLAATASRPVAALAALPALAISLALLWGVVRRGLVAAPGRAAAIVAMLIVLGAAFDFFGDAAMWGLFAAQ